MPKKRNIAYLSASNGIRKNRYFHALRFNINITSLNGQFQEYKTREGGPINNVAKVIIIVLPSKFFPEFFPS